MPLYINYCFLTLLAFYSLYYLLYWLLLHEGPFNYFFRCLLHHHHSCTQMLKYVLVSSFGGPCHAFLSMCIISRSWTYISEFSMVAVLDIFGFLFSLVGYLL